MVSRTFTDEDRVSDIFFRDMTVGAEDIDALGHASNVAYIRWVQDVARAHSEHVGWDHEAYKGAGVVFVVRRHEVDYLRPALEGQVIRLRTWIANFTAATSLRRTELIHDADEGPQVVARAGTTWALVSTETGRPCRITADLKGAFRRTDAS